MYVRIVTAAVVLFTSGVQAQDAVVADLPRVSADQHEQQLRASVEIELKLLRAITGLSEEATTGITLGMKPLLASESQRLAKQTGGTILRTTTHRMTRKLRQSLVAAAEDLVKDPALAKQYQDDLESRVDFARKSEVKGFIANVDQVIRLHEDQLERVTKISNDLHDQHRLPDVMLIMSPMRLMGFAPEPLKDVLTESQFKYLKQHSSQGLSNFAGAIAVGPGAEPETPPRDERRKKLVDELRIIAGLQTDWLRADLKLSDAQVRRLNLAAKGVIDRAAARKLDAEEAVAESMKGPQPQPPDFDTMRDSQMDAVQLFAGDERWQKFVTAALTEEQKKAYQKLRRARGERLREVMSYVLVRGMGTEVSFSGKQQEAVRKLIVEAIPPIHTTELIPQLDVYQGIFSIPDEKYKAAMGEDNWKAFSPQLERAKRQMEDMRARRNPDDAEK